MSNSLFSDLAQPLDGSQSQLIRDAIFQVTGDSGLRLAVAEGFDVEASDFLSAEVSRSPLKIKNHIRRVWLQYDRKQSDLLFAALLDLWIALNGSGRALFRRLLLGAKEGLQANQFEQLASLYTLKEFRKNEYPECSGSVLNRGVSGSLDLVMHSEDEESESSAERDPLQEAREFLEYSQVEQAQRVLEKALVNEPLREAVHSGLLEIYRSTRDLEALNKMRENLDGEENPFLSQWDEAKEQITQELTK